MVLSSFTSFSMRLIKFLPVVFLSVSLISCRSGMLPLAKDLPPGMVRDADGTVRVADGGGQQRQMQAPPDTISYWDGGGAGPARIKIDISEQTAYFYRGAELVGKSWLSTGSEGYRTPTGSFRIIQKNKWHKSSRYGALVDANGVTVDPEFDTKKDKIPAGLKYDGAKMTNFMRLTPEGVGMHAGFLPGYPASHGCIRMPEHMSEHFFNNVAMGTPVSVVP